MNHGVGGTFRFNRGHVAGHALASGAAVLMVRVLFERRRSRTVGREWSVAFQAKLVGRLSQLRVIVCAMYIVAIEAGDAAPVHHALHEIVPLHPVFVRGAVCEIIKVGLGQGVVLELPEILQPEPHLVAHRPIVVFPFNRTR